MSIFEQIMADRDKGTSEPWKTGQCSWDEDTGDVRYTLHDVKSATPADARRIARVPQLERIALAAEELFEALEDGLCNSGTPGFDHHRLSRAQDAFRDACK